MKRKVIIFENLKFLKVWIQTNDIVLVALRDFQDDKCDVILKYFPEEVKQLKNSNEIPEVREK
jgi:translation initiation factor 1A